MMLTKSSDSTDNNQKDRNLENQPQSKSNRVGLKISMRHFEDALKKITKRNDFHTLDIPDKVSSPL